jgi:hypothetical protein
MPNDIPQTPAGAVGPIRVADGLGVASAALAAPMLLAPRKLLDQIGIRPDPRPTTITIAVGVRELVATFTILGMRHRRVGAWSRVGGDLIDLSLLARALPRRGTNRSRLIGAMSVVGGILAADLATALKLNHAEGANVVDGSMSSGAGAPPDAEGTPARVRTAITVHTKDETALRQRFNEFEWQAFDPAKLQARGEVRFQSAPGDRGIEIHLDHDPTTPGGAIGASALKLVGRSPDQKINDDLRRFKALVETGVEVRSEKTPQPYSSKRQIMQQPAQPVGGTA